MTNARYVWNFGDGVTSEGQKVFHTYMYPGSYALSLSVSQGYSMGTGYTTLQAVPAQLSLQAQADGSAVLSNASSQNANVGLWSIGPSAGAFIIPENTTVLAKQSIRFAPAVMRFSANASTSLFYPNGTQAATSGAPAPAAASVTPTSVALPVSPTPLAGTPAQAPIKKSSGAKTTPTHTTTIEAGPNSSLGADGQSAADLSAAAAGALPEGSSPILWESLLGLGALVVLGVAGVWYIKSPSGVDASESLPHGGATDALDSSDFSIDSIDE